MKLQDIVGHEKIKELFLNSIKSNKLGHAYILEGIRGVGKQSIASAVAQLVLCEENKDGQADDACDVCKNCAMIKAGSHPDVKIVTNELYGIEKTSNIIAVDTIREMKKDVYSTSILGGRRFFIIPNADTMNVNAQNSLLKVFEEPPQNTTIILLCENSNLLVQTIRSRAVKIQLFPLSRDNIMYYLMENQDVGNDNETQIAFAATSSNGSIGYAKELIEDEDVIEIQNSVCDFMLGILNADYTQKYGFILFLKKHSADINFIMSFMMAYLRDMLVAKQSRQEYGRQYGEKLYSIFERTSSRVLMNLLEIVLEYSDKLGRKVNYKTAVHCFVLEIWDVVN